MVVGFIASSSSRTLYAFCIPYAISYEPVTAEREGRALDIDLVGYPDSLERYRLFNRDGLRIPLPYSTWCVDRPCCLAVVASAPEGLGS